MSAGRETTVTRVSGLQRRTAVEPQPRQVPISKVLAEAREGDEEEEEEADEAASSGPSPPPRRQRKWARYAYGAFGVVCVLALVGTRIVLPRAQVGGYGLWRAALLLNVAVFSFGLFT
ncbi:hypothetical protein KFL_010980010, partial [Klebsormidium nitens]